MTEHYSETVVMPLNILFAVSTLTSLIAIVLLGAAMMPVVDSIQKELPFLLSAFVICWATLFILLRLTKTVKNSVEDILQWSGQHGPTLIIQGNRRGTKQYIPLQMIEGVTEVSFEGPWWKTSVTGAPTDSEVFQTGKPATWWRRFLNLRNENDPVPTSTEELFGYRGPGLLVTYQAATLASGGDVYLWKQQFPTNDPVRLKSIIDATRQ